MTSEPLAGSTNPLLELVVEVVLDDATPCDVLEVRTAEVELPE